MLARPSRAQLDQLEFMQSVTLVALLEEQILAALLAGAPEGPAAELLELRVQPDPHRVRPWFEHLEGHLDEMLAEVGDHAGWSEFLQLAGRVREPLCLAEQIPVGEPLDALIELGVELTGPVFASVAGHLLQQSREGAQDSPSLEKMLEQDLTPAELVALAHRWLDRALEALEARLEEELAQELHAMRLQGARDVPGWADRASLRLQALSVELTGPAAPLMLELGLHLRLQERAWALLSEPASLAGWTQRAGELAIALVRQLAPSVDEPLRQQADFWRRPGLTSVAAPATIPSQPLLSPPPHWGTPFPAYERTMDAVVAAALTRLAQGDDPAQALAQLRAAAHDAAELIPDAIRDEAERWPSAAPVPRDQLGPSPAREQAKASFEAWLQSLCARAGVSELPSAPPPDTLALALSTWSREGLDDPGDDDEAAAHLRQHLCSYGLVAQPQDTLRQMRGIPSLYVWDRRAHHAILVKSGPEQEVREAFAAHFLASVRELVPLLAPLPRMPPDLQAMSHRDPLLRVDALLRRSGWFAPDVPVGVAMGKVEELVRALSPMVSLPLDQPELTWTRLDELVMRLRGPVPPETRLPEDGLCPLFLLCGLSLVALEVMRRALGGGKLGLCDARGWSGDERWTLMQVNYRPALFSNGLMVNLAQKTLERYTEGASCSIAELGRRSLGALAQQPPAARTSGPPSDLPVSEELWRLAGAVAAYQLVRLMSQSPKPVPTDPLLVPVVMMQTDGQTELVRVSPMGDPGHAAQMAVNERRPARWVMAIDSRVGHDKRDALMLELGEGSVRARVALPYTLPLQMDPPMGLPFARGLRDAFEQGLRSLPASWALLEPRCAALIAGNFVEGGPVQFSSEPPAGLLGAWDPSSAEQLPDELRALLQAGPLTVALLVAASDGAVENAEFDAIQRWFEGALGQPGPISTLFPGGWPQVVALLASLARTRSPPTQTLQAALRALQAACLPDAIRLYTDALRSLGLTMAEASRDPDALRIYAALEQGFDSLTLE